ncbi:MAG: hypothetical protein ACYC2U_01755 [Candidatus Amoebophilus sp.]
MISGIYKIFLYDVFETIQGVWALQCTFDTEAIMQGNAKFSRIDEDHCIINKKEEGIVYSMNKSYREYVYSYDTNKIMIHL